MNRPTILRAAACTAAAIALISFAAAAIAAEKPRDFAFGVPLSVDGDSAFYRVALPAAFYAGSARADQGDLRVFNVDDAAVPFARVEPPPATREKRPATPMPFFPLRVDQDSADLSGMSLTVNRTVSGAVTVNVTTRDGVPVRGQRVAGYLVDATRVYEPIAAIVLAWSPRPGGLNDRIRIDASDDLNQWRTLVGDAPLLDLEYDGHRLLRDRVELRQVAAKYLRISWTSAQPPLQLESVRAEFADRVVDAERQWTTATGTAVADKENEYQFDLGGALPVDRVAVELPEMNSVAPAQLLARAGADEPWRAVTSLVTYRLRQDGAEVSAPPVGVGPLTYRYWLLRVDPKSGGLGRGEPRLHAGWIAQEIVFAARGTGPFMLAYGNVAASPAALPVATLVPGYGGASALGSVALAHPGAAAPLGDLAHTRPAREYRRAALWAVLVLGVALLAWMAWQLSRQLNAPPRNAEPADEPPAQ